MAIYEDINELSKQRGFMSRAAKADKQWYEMMNDPNAKRFSLGKIALGLMPGGSLITKIGDSAEAGNKNKVKSRLDSRYDATYSDDYEPDASNSPGYSGKDFSSDISAFASNLIGGDFGELMKMFKKKNTDENVEGEDGLIYNQEGEAVGTAYTGEIPDEVFTKETTNSDKKERDWRSIFKRNKESAVQEPTTEDTPKRDDDPSNDFLEEEWKYMDINEEKEKLDAKVLGESDNEAAAAMGYNQSEYINKKTEEAKKKKKKKDEEEETEEDILLRAAGTDQGENETTQMLEELRK